LVTAIRLVRDALIRDLLGMERPSHTNTGWVPSCPYGQAYDLWVYKDG
jgi:hypothetical protein